MNDESENKQDRGRWYVFAVVFVFLTIIFAFVLGYDADAAALPKIFMGTFTTTYDGADDAVAQQPETGNVIATPRTVVIAGSRWRLVPGFQIDRAKTSDGTMVKITRVKKRLVRIKAMKVGTATITLTGTGGEKKEYEIIVEDPQVKSLMIKDFVRLKEGEYITGVKYLKPTEVRSSRKKIAQIYQSIGNSVINVFGSGRTRITVKYGRYSRRGTIRAKLPYVANKNMKLSTKPKKIRIKNVPDDWTPVFHSTDSGVAVAGSNGYVTPKGNGTCTIYTRIGNTYLICHVTVSGYK